MAQSPYDPRSRPERGVDLRPLPKHMHREFKRFCEDLRKHAGSHYGTWRYASQRSDDPTVHANAIYWRSVCKYINTLEFFGTNGSDDR